MCNRSYFAASAEWASEMGFFDDIPWSVMKKVKLEDEYYIEFHDESNGDECDGMGAQCYLSVSFRFDAVDEKFYYETYYNGSSIFALNMCGIEWNHYCEDCDEYVNETDECGWDDLKGKCGKCVEEQEEEERESCGCCNDD